MELWYECIKLAQKAAKKNEVPIGAIIVIKGKIIAKGYNKREKKHDILGHAEIMAIKKAAKRLKTWKLEECELYVTLKPCTMCEAVIKQSRIKKVYYLVEKPEEKKEFSKTTFEKQDNKGLEDEYKEILSAFFKKKRQEKI